MDPMTETTVEEVEAITHMGPSEHQRNELARIRVKWPEAAVVDRITDGTLGVDVGVRRVWIPLTPQGPPRVGNWWQAPRVFHEDEDVGAFLNPPMGLDT